MAPEGLPPIPIPNASLERPLLSVPGSEALVFAASAARDATGMASPFVESLRRAWGTERAALADLFLFGSAVPLEAVPDGPALSAAGLVVAVGPGLVASRFRVSPVLGTVVLADAPLGHPDAVLPPSPTTASLTAVMPAAPGRTLDVGCGSGTLALVAAARGAPEVVAIDRSPRACDLTRFNQRLHGAAVDVRRGDLLDPVAGETFALVVSQPPFLPLPPGVPETGYLHGGEHGDETARRLVAALPAVLAPGGVGIVRADRAVAAEPYAGIELSWPGPNPDDLAVAYAAVHVPEEGAERDDVIARYRSHLPRFRSALVVATPDDRRAVIELEGQPASWDELVSRAGL